MKIPHWQEMVHARIQFMDLALPTPDGNQWLAAPPIDVLHPTLLAPSSRWKSARCPATFSASSKRVTASWRSSRWCSAGMLRPRSTLSPGPETSPGVYRYFGYAYALGVDQLYNPSSYFGGAGIVVRRSPVDWLFANCSGLVILDRNEFAKRLRAASNVIAHCRVVGDSVAHARDLAKTLSPLPRNVELFVPSKVVAA